MKKTLFTLSLILTLCLTLVGCDLDIEDETVTVSGDLTYYAAMDEDTLEEKCEGNLIEVSGNVSYSGYSSIYIGDRTADGLVFKCDFTSSDDLENIEDGDFVTVRGDCSSCYASTVSLRNCQIIDHIKEDDLQEENKATETIGNDVTDSTSETTDGSTQSTIDTSSETTTASTTKSQHAHNFSAATCTSPKTCSCGATEGIAKGHTWKAATCKKPKTCTSCNATEGSVADHSWKNATYTSPKTCTVCGVTEGNPLDVPGIENYHGHVYTGGSSSKKFHYESNCAGKNSHEITWDEVERRGLGSCGTCVLK